MTEAFRKLLMAEAYRSPIPIVTVTTVYEGILQTKHVTEYWGALLSGTFGYEYAKNNLRVLLPIPGSNCCNR